MNYKQIPPFSWFSRLGMNLLPMFADESSSSSSPDDKCCSLTHPQEECSYSDGDKSTFSCPEGFYPAVSLCCEGTQMVACGECSASGNEWEGPFACSIWYYTGDSC